MMRILHVADLFWPSIGGVETLLASLLPAQIARGHRVELVTGALGGRPDRESWQGVTVHRLPIREAFETHDLEALIRSRRGMQSVCASFQPDITHVHLTGPAAVLYSQTRRSEPAPWIATLHTPLPATASDPTTPAGSVLRAADVLVTVSDAMLEALGRLAPDVVQHSRRVHNALAFETVAEPAPWPSEPALLCIGRIIEEKGFDLAIRAFARVIDREGEDLRLRIAGDGPALPGLRDLAERLGVAAAVDFLGWVEPRRVAAEMDRATAVVVPSRWPEPFGLVALEASARGRPLIVTRAGGLPEIVQDGVTGIAVPVDDVSAMADAIVRMTQADGPGAVMGRHAIERVRSAFSLDSMVEQYETIYADVSRTVAKCGS